METHHCPCHTLTHLAMFLDALAKGLESEAKSKEQWDALDCLKGAARYTHSAAVWLYRHEEKYPREQS